MADLFDGSIFDPAIFDPAVFDCSPEVGPDGSAPTYSNGDTQTNWALAYRKRHLPEMKLLTGLLEYYKTQREENKN